MSDADRLMELEVRVAFQDKLIAELDGVVRSMGTELERLTEAFDALVVQIAPGSQATVDEKPPHY